MTSQFASNRVFINGLRSSPEEMEDDSTREKDGKELGGGGSEFPVPTYKHDSNGYQVVGTGVAAVSVLIMSFTRVMMGQNIGVTVKWRHEPTELLIYSGPIFIPSALLFIPLS